MCTDVRLSDGPTFGLPLLSFTEQKSLCSLNATILGVQNCPSKRELRNDAEHAIRCPDEVAPCYVGATESAHKRERVCASACPRDSTTATARGFSEGPERNESVRRCASPEPNDRVRRCTCERKTRVQIVGAPVPGEQSRNKKGL